MKMLVMATACLLMATGLGCSRGTDGPSGGGVTEHGLSLDSGSASAGEAAAAGVGGTLSGPWPKWLGPNGDGVSHETGWNVDWSSSAPEKLWQHNVGTGFSSMAVVDGRLYTMGHRDHQERVHCLDARTGEEKWTYGYPGELVANMHEGGPGATPTIDNGLVYTLGREGQLHCVRADDGRPVWSKLLPQELGVDLPEWGFTCSPLVIGDIVVVEAGRTVAFNKKTGEKIWQTAKYHSGYGSPHLFTRGREVLIAVLNNDYLMVLRAEDGSEVAKEEWETPYKTNATTPIVHDDHLFVSSGYNKGCGQFRFDGKSLEFVYGNKSIRNHFNNCVLFEGHLYGIDGQTSSSRNCSVVCMDWATGKVEWKQRGMGCGSLLVADGKLLILSDKGQLVLAVANPGQFKKLGTTQPLTGKCWTVPVLADGLIYCRNAAGDIACLDVRLDGRS